MRALPLRTYDLPDVGDQLIHFTGRRGTKTVEVDQHNVKLSPEKRLVQILVDRVIRGFETFGSDASVVCLSESTKASVPKLVREGRSRLVRFWPGAEADPGEQLRTDILRPSEWLHEREWRVPTEFRFGWHDVKFLIVPNTSWQRFYAERLEDWAGEDYATVFANIPAVVMDRTGSVLRDESRAWT